MFYFLSDTAQNGGINQTQSN